MEIFFAFISVILVLALKEGFRDSDGKRKHRKELRYALLYTAAALLFFLIYKKIA
jgi:hypothetical protein